MSVDLTPEVEAKIRKWVESGRYSDANVVVGEAMRLLIEHEQLENQMAPREIGRQDEPRGEPIELAPDAGKETPSQS